MVFAHLKSQNVSQEVFLSFVKERKYLQDINLYGCHSQSYKHQYWKISKLKTGKKRFALFETKHSFKYPTFYFTEGIH